MTPPADRTYARPLDACDTVAGRIANRAGQVVAEKTVAVTDPYLSGHFPTLTLYPAVFLLEGVRQSVEYAARDEAQAPFLDIIGVVSLRVLQPMLEGDRLVLTTVVGPGPDEESLRARCTVTRVELEGDPDVVTARLTVDLAPAG